MAWSEQSVVSSMLNPALLSAIIASSADGYKKESDIGLPWTLSFIVAPMVLHRRTRDALPANTRTHLATWISRNPTLRAGFPLRAEGLVQPVKEGLRFGLAHGVFHLEGGHLITRPRRRLKGFRPSKDLDEMTRKANMVGRWLTKSDSQVTVFALLGVAP